MATANNRRPQPGRVTGETIALFVVLGLVMVALVTVYAAAKFGHQIAVLGMDKRDGAQIGAATEA